MANNKEVIDMSAIVANVDKVRKMKAAKAKKPSTSIKPLKIEPNDDDTPLKAEIVRRINAKNLTYSDIYAYCTTLKGGDIAEGQKFGYNLISGLKNRRSMIDSTLSILCDFLGLDILFVERSSADKDSEETLNDTLDLM